MTVAIRPLDIAELPAVGPAVLVMGVFDGVHRGHQRLLGATRDAAIQRGVASVALVFDPPPIEVLQPGVSVVRLAPVATNLARVEAFGISHAFPVRFDDAVRALAPHDFLASLERSIELRALVMTPNSAFGRGRSGTPDAMREVAAARGFEVVVADPLLVDGDPVSSTRIRDAIARGDTAAAADLLGRPPLLSGRVVAGDRRGRELGFPTANLAFDYVPALPPLGIYVGRVWVPERDVGPGHPALVSIGVRPTFHESGTVLVEVYLLDFDGDLYDALLTVELGARLREERRFVSVAELVDQMRADEEAARRLLDEGAVR